MSEENIWLDKLNSDTYSKSIVSIDFLFFDRS